MVLFECFSSQVFLAQNFLVMQSTLTAFVVGAGAHAAVCSTGGGCQSRVAPCTDGTSFAPRGHVSGHVVLGGLPDAATGERLGQLIDAMDRSVEELSWQHMTYSHIFHQFVFCDISPSDFLTLLTHTDQSEKITYSSCPNQFLITNYMKLRYTFFDSLKIIYVIFNLADGTRILTSAITEHRTTHT